MFSSCLLLPYISVCKRISIVVAFLGTVLAPISVSANSAPVCDAATATPQLLWPANHKFTDIEIEGVSDPEGGEVDIAVQCIRQDEPLNSTGDGNFVFDASGVGSSAPSVRRERKGNGNGRVYHISYVATDSDGWQCGGIATVGVPKSKKKIPVDGGALYDSVPNNNADCDTTNINNGPVASDQAVEVLEDGSVEISLEYFDADSDALTVTITSPTGSGEITTGAEFFTYTPEADYFGDDSFTYIVNDGLVDSAPATVSITVNPVNDPPLAFDAAVEVEAGDIVVLPVEGSDKEGDNLTFRVDSLPTVGIILDDTLGLRYQSDAGFEGDVEIEYVVNDGELDSEIATVVVTVVVRNEPPVITSSALKSVSESDNYSYSVIAEDPNGDALTYSSLITPQGLTIDEQSGVISWTENQPWVQTVSAYNSQCFTVPEGYQNAGTGGVESGFYNPLFQRVRAAIENGSDYTAPNTKSWHDRHTCLGCHVQTQTLVGLQASQDKVDVDETVAEFLLAEILGSQVGDGAIRRSHPQYAQTQTAFALWALSYVPDFSRTFDVRAKGLGFFLNRKIESDTQVWWRTDHSTGWLRTSDAITAVLALTTGQFLSDASKVPELSAEQLGVIVSYRELLPKIARYLLDRPGGSNNLLSSLRIIGLAEARKHIIEANLLNEIDMVLSSDDSLLRGRQNDDGGWGYTVGSNSDPLTSAWVGFALDYQSPPLTDPVVQGNIAYLLESQRSNGTWRTSSGLFSTDLGTTSLVMAYLPIALEFLGSPDLYAYDVHLDDDQLKLTTVVGNRGLGDVLLPFNVNFFDGPPAQDNLIGVVAIQSLRSNLAETVSIDLSVLPENDVYIELEVSPETQECNVDNNQIRASLIRVQATDPRGLSDTQSFLVNVLDINEAPEIISAPVTQLVQGLPYDYTVLVSDADVGDSHQYTLASAPDGLTVDGNSGEFSYDISALQAGSHDVEVVATDLRGLVGQQSFQLVVLANTAPTVVSAPITTVRAGVAYEYQVIGQDADSDTLSYRLLSAPLTMSIDSGSGLIQWNTDTTYIGSHSIEVEVSDARGGEAVQVFELTVAENQLPIISSSPIAAAALNLQYTYQIEASDPDGDLLFYKIDSGPDGMQVDENGLVVYTPIASQVGSNLVSVVVSDEFSGAIIQTFELEVFVPNSAPEITSTPPDGLNNGAFEYDVEATDLNGDVLSYSLTSAPVGMTVNGQTGAIYWESPVTGEHVINIDVSDGKGGTATQSFTLSINENASPEIISNPSTTQLVLGSVFAYQVVAVDPEGQQLTYGLEQSPVGMSIDQSGQILFEAVDTQLGVHTVEIKVSDSSGLSATQQFELTVIESLEENQAPVIVSQPPGSVAVGNTYTYSIVAEDADGDTIAYSIVTAPDGALVDAVSGLLDWTPTQAQLGVQEFSVRADDGNGGASIQSFSLQVADGTTSNSAPVITSLPEFVTRISLTYEYNVLASDAESDPLSYLIVDAPNGVMISDSGSLTWDTPVAGMHQIRMRVVDSQQAFSEQSWQLTVLDESQALSGTLTVSPLILSANDVVTISVQPRNAIGSTSISVDVDGTPVLLNQDGTGQLNASGSGSYLVSATITDRYETVVITQTYFVQDGSDTEPPQVSFSGLNDGDVISAPIDIIATASDDNIDSWRLSYESIGQNNIVSVLVAEGSTSPVDELLATFDPTLLVNGQYKLVLEASDQNGWTTREEVSVLVDGDMKVGNFSITYEDLSIPMSGLPISVRRTYDSRQKAESQDFGYGWSIDYQDVQIDETRTPGNGWALNSYGYGPVVLGVQILQNNCVEAIGEPKVTVTLPDGEVESFSIKAHPECTENAIERTVRLVFESDSGTTSTLESLDTSYGYFFPGNQTIGLITDPTPLDPNRYRLTTQAGYEYTLDQSFGIETVVDPNGNTITYSDSGISHSAGKSITFIRDAGGRITEIEDPKGNLISYSYDGSGDLAGVTDRAFATTSFTYNSNHGLLEIQDPLGQTPLKNIYDDNGRLIAQEDSDGNRTEFNHDIDGRQSIITDRLGRTTFLYYDERGNVTSQVDALGNTSSNSYDANDNQLSETNALNHTTLMSWDDDDNQLSQTDPLGNTVEYAYNSLGQETEITDELGRIYKNTYDSVGNLLTMTDPEGNIAGNNINAQGLVTLMQDQLGNGTNYEYDSEGNKTKETDATGAVSTYTYDDNNNQLTESVTRTVNGVEVTETITHVYSARDQLTQSTDALGNVTKFEYDLKGQESAQVDARGQRTEMSYDNYGRLTQTTYPDATFSSHTYDAEGNKLTDTDRLGRTTSYTYDALNRVIKTTYPDASETSQTYDAAGRMTSTTDARNNTTTYEYDAANRRTAVVDVLGNRHTYNYDAAGNILSETDARSNTVSYTYNDLDQRTQVTYADANTMSDTLDALGRRTKQTDEASISTDYAYDELGRLTSVTDAAGNITRYTYDETGNKLTQTDAENRTTSWTYDALGRVASRTLPLGQVETFGYDANGNRTSHTDFNGNTHTFVYDNNDRMNSATYADGSVTTYTYNAVGNRIESSITDSDGTRTWAYGYDNRDRLVLETKPNGSTLVYQYDAAGNKSQLITTLANGTLDTISYTYDVLNRLESVTNSEGTSTYGYDDVGNRTSLSNPNGASQTWAYDSRNRLTLTNIYNGAGALIQSFDYTLHPTGRRTKITELDGRTSDYTYNNRYWVTLESIADAVNGNYSASYVYDMVGNRIEGIEAGVTTAYSYDANDRISQQGGVTYSYDANGNTLSNDDQGVITNYAYNSQNQMVEHSLGGITTQYQYNPDGIRHNKYDFLATTSYLVDGNRSYAQVLAESIDGMVDVTYHFGDDLISQSRDSTTHYFHVDGLGSTRVLTDASGNSTDSYAYAAFGEILNQSGVADNSYLYTGEQYDAVLDQYYLRARYYDQGVGRFSRLDDWMGLEKDPISLNKYAYANADPANFIDPTGNFGLGSISASLNARASLTRSSVSSYSSQVSRAIGSTINISGRVSTKAARKLLNKCIKKSNKCDLGFNILIVGWNTPDLVQHIRSAQQRNPRTFVVTYDPRVGGKKGGRRWYASGNGLGKCTGSTPSGKSCDEYPFYRSREGGKSNFLNGRVSLNWVNAWQNSYVGIQYGVIAKAIRRSKKPDKKVVVVTTHALPTLGIPANR